MCTVYVYTKIKAVCLITYSICIQVTLNVKHTFFDKISSIGGTLGLFCGVSMISILELLYYILLFLKRVTSRKEETSADSRFD